MPEQRVPDLGDLDRERQPDHGPVRSDRLAVDRDPAAGRLDDVGPEPLLVLPGTSKIRACPLTTPSDRRPDESTAPAGAEAN